MMSGNLELAVVVVVLFLLSLQHLSDSSWMYSFLGGELLRVGASDGQRPRW